MSHAYTFPALADCRQGTNEKNKGTSIRCEKETEKVQNIGVGNRDVIEVKMVQ